jgi:hypothetical protein
MESTMNRRRYDRKLLDPIHVTDIKAPGKSIILAHRGTILNASAGGLLIRIGHSDLNADILRHTIPLHTLEGGPVVMTILEMALTIEGKVVRTDQVAPEWCDIAIDFTDNAPPYWRECLAELLPSLGEMARDSVSERTNL